MAKAKPRLSKFMAEEFIDALIGPVCEIADTETAAEAGHQPDPIWDEFVKLARQLRDREGFWRSRQRW